jgi:hypothetical protein
VTTLAEPGEFGLIEPLTTGLPQSPHVIVGVGDDAALLDALPLTLFGMAEERKPSAARAWGA